MTIGARPIEGIPFMIQSKLLAAFKLELLHENVFYEDVNGILENRGFFSHGPGRDPGFPSNISTYRFERPFSPSGEAAEFIRSLESTFRSIPYNLLFCNCQEFADRVRRGRR